MNPFFKLIFLIFVTGIIWFRKKSFWLITQIDDSYEDYGNMV